MMKSQRKKEAKILKSTATKPKYARKKGIQRKQKSKRSSMSPGFSFVSICHTKEHCAKEIKIDNI